ncbi:MAG: GGDEF domain-containing protein [Butyrivibrio sp.]|nr:GGDEF domain-containing protein [Butyrivibrio sp.]
MDREFYDAVKDSINLISLPCCIFSLEKNEDGSCKEMKFFAVNNTFLGDFIILFYPDKDKSKSLSDFEKEVEGSVYSNYIPKEPKFEAFCYRAAFVKEPCHTYVDTTKMYGYWTEDYLLPIGPSDNPNIGYCQFIYTLNKNLDTGKYSTVSPDIASFTIKACLELRNEEDFHTSISVVNEDLRAYTGALGSGIITLNTENEHSEIICQSVEPNYENVRNAFAQTTYKIIQGWEKLLAKTNSIIINSEADRKLYEEQYPEWLRMLKDNGIDNVCLVPFIHKELIIGYFYLLDFDREKMSRIKETAELISFFLSSEVASHLFLERLEYLSNVDILTGVSNRNCMNIDVNELATRLEIEPHPFSVAFCDLNGLKNVNDNCGHDKGDKLIMEAAALLKEIFKGDKIYRAGGDEFTIISIDCSKEEFEKKIATLRERACDPDWIYFAIGHYSDATTGKLRLALRYADENMYKDKNAFYEKYPDKRR